MVEIYKFLRKIVDLYSPNGACKNLDEKIVNAETFSIFLVKDKPNIVENSPSNIIYIDDYFRD
jgi:hypothetical protein